MLCASVGCLQQPSSQAACSSPSVGPASAADPGTTAGKDLSECLTKALDTYKQDKNAGDLKNAVDDCHKAASIVVPAAPELLWGSIAVPIVLGVLVKFAFPTLKKTMSDRTEKIRSDLDGAASAKAQAEEELATDPGEPQLAQRGPGADRDGEGPCAACACRHHRPGRDRGGRDQGPRAPTTSASPPSGPRPTSSCWSRTSHRARREGRRAQPRPRDPASADRQLHQSGREQLR